MLRVLIFLLFLFPIIAFAEKPIELSLSEAILLAVRENPNIQKAQLNHIEQKFALHVQEWMFKPHFAFNASRTVATTTWKKLHEVSKQGFVQPSMTWQSPIGTQLTVTSINNISDHYYPGVSVEVMQPLMRGFGKAVVEASLYNARDSEYISRLSIEAQLQDVVTNVINAYLDVVSAQHTLENDIKSLARAQNSVKETQLFIKAGHKAGNEVVTVEADVANAQTTLENDKNLVEQAKYALLETIGIDPNTKVKFTTLDIAALIKKYHVPTLVETKSLSIQNDIQYQIDRITFEGATQRNLTIAKDNTRPQLDLTLKGGVGAGAGGEPGVGFFSLFQNTNRTQSATLSLTIPIDDQVAKQAVVGAKIAIREAQISLQQERWKKETVAINGWNNYASAARALRFAENAARLQNETYNITYKKYLFGLIDSTALQSVQSQLITADQALVSAKIGFLKSLVQIDLLTGHTLKTWQVHIRY